MTNAVETITLLISPSLHLPLVLQELLAHFLNVVVHIGYAAHNLAA